MKKRYRILSAIGAALLVAVCIFLILFKTVGKREEVIECKSVAVINNSYYKVFETAEESEINYEYYYKSIKVKETKEEYVIILIDWRTETEQEQTYNKSKWVVILSH